MITGALPGCDLVEATTWYGPSSSKSPQLLSPQGLPHPPARPEIADFRLALGGLASVE